jgi:hypothetical protein
VQETFSYHCVTLFTVDSDAEQVVFRASSHPDVQRRGVRIPWGSGIVGWAAAQGEPVISNNVREDERYLSAETLARLRQIQFEDEDEEDETYEYDYEDEDEDDESDAYDYEDDDEDEDEEA